MPGLLRHTVAALAVFCVLSLPARAAAPCEGALGTSRVMEVPAAGLQLGTKHFPQTLDLTDGEVVLTFDDGPHPGTTPAVLKALAKECVRATFFLIGRNASAHPDLARRLVAEGHTVAYHSQTHPMTLADLPFDKAVADIEKGFVSVDKAAYGSASAHPRTPFFRFPGFGSSPELLKYLGDRGIDTFGADLWASDWNPMTPDQQLKLLMERLDHQRRGIILLHDTREQTARMVPAFLAELKAKGYRVVHVVPAGVTTAAKP
ncbi:peptidoglycan/xylan/chitin deacetylase (PgdA/CDA1 family) [Angulomicrobium tetraedrale]|uniref:Chitooligosaccharide deacetylase n=1 Tax=Ancylobacter tetraedralis TaxID=217068 RepID=A0A839Z7L6_9HYPH|nr:polysaccharide deacetylase family protein [Ancylobacter tetraedralis]MBB3771111.1 peptidoglycan/xylan/chitin deacetylase (PgdA/CDA1 family) [Ancylobacter tetraedralis]